MQGTYVLFLEAKKVVRPEIGKLGKVRFGKGLYAYVGSAMGKSVNLESRVKRLREVARRRGGGKW